MNSRHALAPLPFKIVVRLFMNIKRVVILFILWIIVVNFFAVLALNRFNLKGDTAYTWIDLSQFSQNQQWNPIFLHARWDSFWYLDIAQRHGLNVCQMAFKFVDKQNFVTSTIIGATNIEQLKTNIDAFDIELSDDVMADIDKVYRQYPIPF